MNWKFGSAAAAMAVVTLVIGAFGVGALAPRALAHGGATGIVKERMDLMDAIGEAMKELTALMRGKEPYDAGRVRTLADRIGAHGGEKLTSLFPAGSLMGTTEALPAIWTDWDRFAALADEVSVYADALAAAADNPRNGSGGMPASCAASGPGAPPILMPLILMPPILMPPGGGITP